jgi:RimJ/RimL family protein N-acetyltransferase
MLQGPRIVLRARAQEDVEVLHTELYDDVAGHARSSGAAWRPHPHGLAPPYAPREPTERGADFSVVRRDDDELLGNALLWGIDPHNRSAHLGLALRPTHRGQGYGSEVVGVLCHYGFSVLGLHRLQLETLADNAAMIGAATASGFACEGTLRERSWVNGLFMDDVVYGVLAAEWSARVGDASLPN